MPAYIRRELLTAAQRAELPALPTDRLEIRERYSLMPADLHGRLDQVRCLDCGALTERAALQSELLVRNPDFAGASVVVKPDGDAELSDVDYQRFEIPVCGACGGMLKPDVVFFGENVPVNRSQVNSVV